MTYELPFDVARCTGYACPIKEKCLRYMAGTVRNPNAYYVVYTGGNYDPIKRECAIMIPTSDEERGDSARE